LHYHLEEIRKYHGRGRPKPGQNATLVGYVIKANDTRNQTKVTATLNSKGRFILATNQLDSEKLADLEVFQEYKKQSQVEGGFRFLKDPWFMLDSFLRIQHELVP